MDIPPPFAHWDFLVAVRSCSLAQICMIDHIFDERATFNCMSYSVTVLVSYLTQLVPAKWS